MRIQTLYDMKIIAVNIYKQLAAGLTPLDATRRAWKLDIKKASRCDYVIGFSKDSVVEYFIIDRVMPDTINPNRVAFKLTPCTPAQKSSISRHISGVTFKYFVTKYL
jgi:hypothetical protein